MCAALAFLDNHLRFVRLMQSMRPSEVLFHGTHIPIALPACDHYAGNETKMRKSVSLQQEMGPVFDITLDCEDGAAPGQETRHAQLVCEIIGSYENRFGRIGARVHDISSCHFERDIEIICRAARKLAYIAIPKADSVDVLSKAIDLINHHAARAGRSDVPVHALIETHGALAAVQSFAALPQVQCLSFGIMDFVSGHYGAIPADAMRSPGQFTHPLVARAKLEIAAACHAHGKIPSHNVTTEIGEPAAVANDANRAAKEFGYMRMWSIHPKQITHILAAFSPQATEIDEAIGILRAAEIAHWGPIQHNGRLHDRASYRYYWMVLQRARSNGLVLPEAATGLS